MKNNQYTIIELFNKIFKLNINNENNNNDNSNKNPMESIVNYYIDMNKNEKTAIPFHNFISIISVLPLIKRNNGKITKCEDCDFFIYTNNDYENIETVNSLKIPSFYGYMNDEHLSQHISRFVELYRPNYHSQRLFNKVKDMKNIHYAVFKYYHQKNSKSCSGKNYNHYLFIGDYMNKLLSIYSNNNHKNDAINHIHQINNYTEIIVNTVVNCEISKKEWLIKTIINEATKILNIIKNSTYMPIYASISYLVLKNNHICSDNIIMRKISNMYCISPTSIYMFIKNYKKYFENINAINF